MEVTLHINGKAQTVPAAPTDTLIAALRQAGYFSVRFGSAVLEAGHTSIPNLVLQHYAELKV